MRSLAVACTDDQVSEWDGLCWSVTDDYFAPGMERDDLMQEARIGVVKALRDFDSEAGVPLAAFVGICVRRQVMSAMTAANREKHRAVNGAVSTVTNRDGEEVDALDGVSDTADLVDLVAARERLHTASRRIRERLTDIECAVLLADIQGDSYAEISARVGVGEKGVDNALQRVGRKLADDFQPGPRGLATGYRCPSCGGPTVKKPGRGRPPRCNVCRLSAAA